MLKKILMKPGVNRENTRYTTEGGWYESDKVRFRQGTPEKIGGWARISANTFTGICRSLWAWATLNGSKLVGTLTDRRSYIEYNGYYNNISPVSETWSSGYTINTTAGSPIIQINLAFYPNNSTQYNWIGSYVYFTNIGSLDANITSTVLSDKYFTITDYSFNTYVKINVGVNAVSTAVYSPTGYINYLEPIYSGYYSQSNFGQDLIFCQRGGQICVWDYRLAGFLSNDGTGNQVYLSIVIFPSLVTTVVTPQAIPYTSGRIPVYFRAISGTLVAPLNPLTKYWLQSNSGSSPSNYFSIYTAETGGSLVTSSGGSGFVNVFLAAQTLGTITGGNVDAPQKCNYVLVSDIYRFVFAFGTNDLGTSGTSQTSTLQPMLIRWCDQEDYTNWTPSATNQAGSLILSRGSEIITAIQARQEILVFTDSAVYSLQYQGPPTVWGAQLVGDNISIVSQNAVSYAAGTAFWMGKDKFYMYNGNVNTLRCDLRQYVFGDINTAQYSQFFSGTNEGFNEVWWFYCSAASSTVDRYVVYNYVEDIWYYGNMDRTAWLDSGILDYPRAATYSYNLVNHEYGVDNDISGTPAAISASITSSEFDVEDGDKFMFIRRILPDLTFRGSTAGSPSGVLTIYPLKNSGSGYSSPASEGGDSTATVTRTATIPVEAFTGQVYVRIRARQIATKWESTALGVTWQLGAMRLDMQPDGKASGSGVSGG